MRRAEAIAALRGCLPILQRDFGVRRIALFGSTARDEAREDGDLDILVKFDVTPALDAFVGTSPDPNRDWRLYAEDIIEACG